MTLPEYPFPELAGDIARVLDSAPIIFCEIGARRGGKRFRAIGRHVRYVGFEPDEKEAARLEQDLARVFTGVRVFRNAVMDREGPIDIHVLRHRGCSSVLTPDPAVIGQYATRRGDTADWPGFFEPVGTYGCQARSLDQVARDAEILHCDFLGIDTQGTEAQILDGGCAVLSRTAIVHVEMEAVPLYRGQALLPDLVSRLAIAGFRLLSLENHQYISRAPAGIDDLVDQGELISVDGLFYRDMDTVGLSADARVAAVVRRMLVLHELSFRTLAIDLGRAASGTDDLPHRLANAMEALYFANNASAQPIVRRARRALRGLLALVRSSQG